MEKLDHSRLKKKKALVISCVASMLDNFNRNNIRLLLESGFEVTLAANFNTSEDINSQEKIDCFIAEMKGSGIQTVQIDFTRELANIRQQIKSMCQVKKLLTRKFDLVHCHSPICAALTRLAFRKYRKKYKSKMIYTAHGFHFYNGGSIKNWLLYYPAEMLLSYWTDILITINHEDYERAKKNFHASKVVYIPGVGVDITKFGVLTEKREYKREKLGLKSEDVVLVSAGKLQEGESYDMVIKAFARLKEQDKRKFSKYHYLICEQSSRKEHLQSLIDELGISSKVHLLGHRDDVTDILNCADAFFFVQKDREILLLLAEAMASGIPCAGFEGSKLIRNGQEGFITEYQENEIACCLEKILGNPKERKKMGIYAWNRIRHMDLPFIQDLQSAYQKEGAERNRRVRIMLDRYLMRMKLGIPVQAFVILSTGELNDNKNHKTVIEAVKELNDTDIYYIICGQGRNQSVYEMLLQENHLEEHVKMMGYQPDVRPFLACADIFAFPSHREGLGMAALEAMSAGLPLLTSRAGGIKDYSVNGVNGYSVSDADDVHAFANAIRWLKKSKQNLYNMSKRNETAAFNFRIAKVNYIMKNLYGDCFCRISKGTK